MKPFLLLITTPQCAIIFSQNSNDILNLLISNKTITQQQADSIRAEAALKQQETDANKKYSLLMLRDSYNFPDIHS